MKDWIENYKKNPKYFWVWLLILIGLGPLGFNAPLVVRVLNEVPLNFGNTIIEGSLSTFSIVILIESILAGESKPKAKRVNPVLKLFTIILVLFHVIEYVCILYGTKTNTIKFMVLISSVVALFVAILFYQFRTVDIEDGAEQIIIKEENEIKRSLINEDSSNNNPVI